MRAIVVSLLLVSSPAFADDAPKAALGPEPSGVVVAVKAGDSWDYELRDGITNEPKSNIHLTVTEVSDGEIDARSSVTNAKKTDETSRLIVTDRNWRLKSNDRFDYKPFNNATGIPDGLAVGKSWTFAQVNKRLTPPQEYKITGSGKVAAWERVTLPSGTAYDAYRIEFTTTTEANGRKFEDKTIEWFAPSANRMVQRTWESRQNGKLADKTLEFLTGYKPSAG
jgi:hypothetical protein